MKKITNYFIKVLGFLVIAISLYFYDMHFIEDEENDEKIEMKETVNVYDKLKIYFIDVGQADSILISNNGEYTLVDAGNNGDGYKLVNYFKDLGIDKFKYVVGTHAHEDHIGGMDNIINNFSIEHFYMPDVITTTKTFEDVLDALDNNNIKFETPSIDSSFYMNDVKFDVLYLSNDKKDLNNSSIVLKVTYYNTSYLLMADATSEIERSILDKGIKSDVLKVSHHGSGYSTIASFLKKVEPKYAVISVGADNEYGLPKDVTLKKLNKMNVKIYRTDLDGTIILTSDGNNIDFLKVHTDTNGG